MSNFERPAMRAFDRSTAPTSTAVDAGLRAYMLHIYNYMMLGLVITGIAAFAIYMLSASGDADTAAKILRNGVEVPAQIRSGVYLTPIGYLLFASPLKWAVILAPLALVFVLSFGLERMRPATAQWLFWIYAALVGISLGVIFMVPGTKVNHVVEVSAVGLVVVALELQRTRSPLLPALLAAAALYGAYPMATRYLGVPHALAPTWDVTASLVQRLREP